MIWFGFLGGAACLPKSTLRGKLQNPWRKWDDGGGGDVIACWFGYINEWPSCSPPDSVWQLWTHKTQPPTWFISNLSDKFTWVKTSERICSFAIASCCVLLFLFRANLHYASLWLNSTCFRSFLEVINRSHFKTEPGLVFLNIALPLAFCTTDEAINDLAHFHCLTDWNWSASATSH